MSKRGDSCGIHIINSRRSMAIVVGVLGALPCLAGSARANLIANPSFEPDMSGWSSSGNVTTTILQGATDGTSALVIGGADGPDNGQVYQTVATNPGQTYQISFDYGAYGNAGRTQMLRIELIGNATLIDQVLTDTGSHPTTFLTFNQEIVADTSVLTLRFSDQSTVTTSIDMMLDNVQLEAVPEPTSLALLGIGVLMLRPRLRD